MLGRAGPPVGVPGWACRRGRPVPITDEPVALPQSLGCPDLNPYSRPPSLVCPYRDTNWGTGGCLSYLSSIPPVAELRDKPWPGCRQGRGIGGPVHFSSHRPPKISRPS
jgi:hypothetical protein